MMISRQILTGKGTQIENGICLDIIGVTQEDRAMATEEFGVVCSLAVVAPAAFLTNNLPIIDYSLVTDFCAQRRTALLCFLLFFIVLRSPV